MHCNSGSTQQLKTNAMKRISTVALGRHLFVIAGLALASTVGSLSAADTYYVSDHLATTTAVADAAGEIASLEADAFGSPLSGGEQAARYTGKPYDADIGAYVFPFRNYRSDEARWMSTDPSGFPDGINATVYAPSVFSEIDPLGLVAMAEYQYFKLIVPGGVSWLTIGSNTAAGGLAGGLGGGALTVATGPGAAVGATIGGVIGGTAAAGATIGVAWDNFTNSINQQYQVGPVSSPLGVYQSQATAEFDDPVQAQAPSSAITGISFSWSLGLSGVNFQATINSTKSLFWTERRE
jgi:RHS repeat-associated protein